LIRLFHPCLDFRENAALHPDLIRSGTGRVKKTHQMSNNEIEPPFRSIGTEQAPEDGASIPEFDDGHWWLAFFDAMPVAFAGLVPSTRAGNAGYFSCVGVLQKHCGNRLQLRLMRAIETRAKRNGWSCVVSDTTDNLASANNFIRAGCRLYQPQYPWAWPKTLYWRKFISCSRTPRKFG
jgi:Acetyltransferase (GNAT) family